MTSPFVRRRRLAAELRGLRVDRGVKSEQLARMLRTSRMKISRLENGRIRPDLGEIMNILDCLEVVGSKRDEIIDVARDAAEKGWWVRFGDALGPRQRLCADLESGASIVREYSHFMIPSVLQTRDYTWLLIERAMAEEDRSLDPEYALEARLRRQKEFLASGGPRYDVVIDEIVIRRPTAPPKIMLGQLRHLAELATRHPLVTLYIVPLAADFTGRALPSSAFSIYTFPDSDDSETALVCTLSRDIVHSAPREVEKYGRYYEHLREVALSATASLGLLDDAVDGLQHNS